MQATITPHQRAAEILRESGDVLDALGSLPPNRSCKQFEAEVRAHLVLEARRLGHTDREIADALGYGGNSASGVLAHRARKRLGVPTGQPVPAHLALSGAGRWGLT